MQRGSLLTILLAATMFWGSSALAQDAIVQPGPNQQNGPSGSVNVFDDVQQNTAKDDDDQTPAMTQAAPLVRSAAPSLDAPKALAVPSLTATAPSLKNLPPSIQKQYDQAIAILNAQQDMTEKDYETTAAHKIQLPAGVTLTPKQLKAYQQAVQSMEGNWNAYKTARVPKQQFEFPGPNNFARDDLTQEVAITLTRGSSGFSQDEKKKISRSFDIPKADVAKSCDLKFYAVANPMNPNGGGALTELVNGGSASANRYRGALRTISVQAYVDCVLPQPPQSPVIITKGDRYVMVIGETTCHKQGQTTVRNPSSVSVEYTGDGNFTCTF